MDWFFIGVTATSRRPIMLAIYDCGVPHSPICWTCPLEPFMNRFHNVRMAENEASPSWICLHQKLWKLNLEVINIFFRQNGFLLRKMTFVVGTYLFTTLVWCNFFLGGHILINFSFLFKRITERQNCFQERSLYQHKVKEYATECGVHATGSGWSV
jgi:hypothetical protein